MQSQPPYFSVFALKAKGNKTQGTVKRLDDTTLVIHADGSSFQIVFPDKYQRLLDLTKEGQYTIQAKERLHPRGPQRQLTLIDDKGMVFSLFQNDIAITRERILFNFSIVSEKGRITKIKTDEKTLSLEKDNAIVEIEGHLIGVWKTDTIKTNTSMGFNLSEQTHIHGQYTWIVIKK